MRAREIRSSFGTNSTANTRLWRGRRVQTLFADNPNIVNFDRVSVWMHDGADVELDGLWGKSRVLVRYGGSDFSEVFCQEGPSAHPH